MAMSATAPSRMTPRSFMPNTAAGRLVIERIANSRGRRPPLANVDGEPAREGAVVARMRLTPRARQRQRRRRSTPSCTAARHDVPDVLVRHVERDDRRVCLRQSARSPSTSGVMPRSLRNLRERLALPATGRADTIAITMTPTAAPPRSRADVLERAARAGAPAARLRPAVPRRRAAAPRAATSTTPRTDTDRRTPDPRARACVDPLRRCHRQPPVVGPERLHVADDARDASLLGDANHFLHRRDDADVVVRLRRECGSCRRRRTRPRRPRARSPPRSSRSCRACRRGRSRGRTRPAPLPRRTSARIASSSSAVGRAIRPSPACTASAHAAMTDEQRDVRPEAALLQRRALRGEIDRTAAVGIDDDRRDALREDRPRLSAARRGSVLRPRANARR